MKSLLYDESYKVADRKNWSILEEAIEITNGSRATDYGDAVESFEQVAMLATQMIGRPIEPDECCIVLMAVKLIRESYKHKRDNLVDLCGYAKILNQIKDSKNHDSKG